MAGPNTFEALSRPELMSRWLNAGPDGHAEAICDFRVGGTFTVKMFGGSGELAASVKGRYLEIDPSRRIVCTWIVKGFVEYSELEFRLETVIGGTELTLTHKLSKPLIEPHSQGWPNCLNRLEEVLEKSN